MRRRCTLAVLAVLLLGAAPLRAGVLWEAELAGVAVRGRLETASGRTVLELTEGPAIPAAPEAAGLRLVEWSRGPRVAGWASRYFVLERGGRICGEVLASRWLGRELAPLWRRLWEELGRRGVRALPVGACGGVGPEVLTSAGFPLAVGDGRRYVFATRVLRFGVPFAPEGGGARSEGE